MYDYQVLQVLRSIDATLTAIRTDVVGSLGVIQEYGARMLAIVAFFVVFDAVSWFVRKGSRL